MFSCVLYRYTLRSMSQLGSFLVTYHYTLQRYIKEKEIEREREQAERERERERESMLESVILGMTSLLAM